MTARVGVMGGTFDPVHTGHLVAASEVAHLFGLDEVVFVPTGRPWQKDDRHLTDPEIRYHMVLVATADDPRFTVSRVDIDRAGPTYTVDTLRDLAAERLDTTLFFIAGADALSSILTWRDPQVVLELAHLVAVSRPGHALGAEHLPRGAVTVVEIPALAISSTDCRRRVASGSPITYLVPSAVERYITTTGLYRTEAA